MYHINPKGPSGFTLIELLTSLLILGILLGMVALNLSPNQEKQLQDEAQKLALLLQQAHDEALSTRRTLAWSGDQQHYEFWRLNENREWQVLTKPEIFRSRTLPEGIAISHLTINHAPVPAQSRIIFSPSGINPGYRITLTHQQQRYYVAREGADASISADAP